MTMAHLIFTNALVSPVSVDDSNVGDGGKEITGIKAVLTAFGVDPVQAKTYMPTVIKGSVTHAATGAVQDPAGSAVGANGSCWRIMVSTIASINFPIRSIIWR